MNGIRALRAGIRDVPIVADLKTMDGGWLEAETMAKAGATHVVVMERAHPEEPTCLGPTDAPYSGVRVACSIESPPTACTGTRTAATTSRN